MNSREAKAVAGHRLAEWAREQADGLRGGTPDHERLERGFRELAEELDTRYGWLPRKAKAVPVDPNQISIMEVLNRAS